jgi:hypothetical protein
VIEDNYIRMKTDHWEDFMFRSGITQAQRIYFTMPGSVTIPLFNDIQLYPTCIQTMLPYKPKKKQKKYE